MSDLSSIGRPGTARAGAFRSYAVAALLVAAACNGANRVTAPPPGPIGVREAAFPDTLEKRTFDFFWARANPDNGLIPDRWPTPSFSSVAAVGFGLTAYPIGVERGYITRDQARDRVLTTLRFLWTAPSGDAATGVTSDHGFFYHFLDMRTGFRFETVELSTIDTSLLLGGILLCQTYFTGGDAGEVQIRALADSLYRRVEWTFVQPRAPLMGMGWTPESGMIAADYKGYDEAMLLYLLALGSPTHPIDAAAWTAWTSTYQWGSYLGYEQVNFGPLFGHQYSQLWVDFRGIRDPYMRAHGIDYFENSRRATLSQRAYAIANPMRWTGYGASVWGLTASDGPLDGTFSVNGASRQFFTYTARGAALTGVKDDGTIAPTAAGGSVPFAPEIAVPALVAMREKYPDAFGEYGFFDAFNPTYPSLGIAPKFGRNVGGVWVDVDYLGIDEGPIVAMIENQRSGLIWRLMRTNPYLVRGLRRAGFTGGWLDSAPAGAPK